MARVSWVALVSVALVGCDIESLHTTLGPPDIPCDPALHGWWSFTSPEIAAEPATAEVLLAEVRPATELTCTASLRHGALGDLAVGDAGEAWLTELDGRRFLNLVLDRQPDEADGDVVQGIAVLELVVGDGRLELDQLARPDAGIDTPEALRAWVSARPRGTLPVQQQYVARQVPKSLARRLVRVEARLERKRDRAETKLVEAAWGEASRAP